MTKLVRLVAPSLVAVSMTAGVMFWSPALGASAAAGPAVVAAEEGGSNALPPADDLKCKKYLTCGPND